MPSRLAARVPPALAIAALLLAAILTPPALGGRAAPEREATGAAAGHTVQPEVATASSHAADRLDPHLRAAVEAARSAERLAASGAKLPPAAADALATVEAPPGEGLDARVYVAIKSQGPLELGTLADKAVSTPWPLGQTVTLARIRLGNLLKVAAIDNVVRVEDAAHPVIETDEAGARPEPDPAQVAAHMAELRRKEVPFGAAPPLAVVAARQHTLSLRPGEEDASARSGAAGAGWPDRGVSPGGATPDGWYDAIGSHNTRAAWRRGWDGKGVRVGVADTGVDFMTPELFGTWAVVDDPASPYAGWPQALDSQGLYQYVQDIQVGSNGSEIGSGGHVQLKQDAVATRVGETDVGTACFKRIRRPAAGQPPAPDAQPTCDYKVPWRSKSGSYRFGPHPDPVLFTNRYPGERVGVLLVDQATAGVYDTVYVDLDNDRDFAEEKPVTQADPAIYRDMDGDGWADLSGGILYWISDGENPPPGAYLWGALTPTPEQGRVLAFLTALGGAHGTQCASNVAAQGVVPVPAAVSLRFRDLPGDGKPPYLVRGAAPGAAVVGIYRGGTLATEASYIYAAYGLSKERPGDEVQVLSNSYGFNNYDNEGWDNLSRLIDHLTTVNRNLSYVFSSGNGGPGYGSIRAPHPQSAIKVAASTQMGSTGMNSITDTTQILWGDIVSFSSSGPGSDGTIGPHVAADGAWATGAYPVNESPNGRQTIVTWGGTSRATPVAAGHVALIYQAFKQKHGRWPTWEEARAILMAGAKNMGYDAFTSGAGVVDGGRSSYIAGGVEGLYASPAVLYAGDYRGTTYGAFPRLVRPGEARTATLTLRNPTDHPITLTQLAGMTQRRIGSYAFKWTSEAISQEDPAITDYPDQVGLPDYVIPIEIDELPGATELMAIRANIPLASSDLNLNYTFTSGTSDQADNLWRLYALRHTDINGDGQLWHDRNGNKVVDRALLTGGSQQIDGARRVNWDQTEMDRWEFMRFGEDTRPNNNLVTWVHHPLERWGDGIYIGLKHQGRPPAVPRTTIEFQIDFYANQPWDWVTPATTPAETIEPIPAGGSRDIAVRIAVPADAPFGFHQGAIVAKYPWRVPFDPNDGGKRLFLPLALNQEVLGVTPAASIAGDAPARPDQGAAGDNLVQLTIPVQLNVAAALPETGSIELAGVRSQDARLPYSNGIVRGANFWNYNRESGDWRYFFVDILQPAAEGTRLVLRSQWQDGKPLDPGSGQPVGRSDIDTLLFGPAADRWSDPDHPGNAEEDLSDPALFGPATTALAGASTNKNTAGGIWQFDTATGDYEEWVTAPITPGLNLVMAHNQLISGDRFDIPFGLSLDRARLQPTEIAAEGSASACQPLTFTPSFALDALVADGYGLSAPERQASQTTGQDNPNDPLSAAWRRTFAVAHGSAIQITIDGEGDNDLDLFLYRDANGDGQPQETEQVAASTSPTADEHIDYRGPQDGTYIITVHGWDVPSGSTTFDYERLAIQGTGVRAEGLPAGGLAGDQAASFEVCYDLPEGAAPGDYLGELVFGPPRVPRLFTVPVRVTVPSALGAAGTRHGAVR